MEVVLKLSAQYKGPVVIDDLGALPQMPGAGVGELLPNHQPVSVLGSLGAVSDDTVCGGGVLDVRTRGSFFILTMKIFTLGKQRLLTKFCDKLCA